MHTRLLRRVAPAAATAALTAITTTPAAQPADPAGEGNPPPERVIELITPGGPLQVPITLTPAVGDRPPTATIRNGPESIEVRSVRHAPIETDLRGRYADTRLEISPYGSVMEWGEHTGPAGTIGTGVWIAKRRGGDVAVRLTVRTPDDLPPDGEPDTRYAGRWRVAFSSSDQPAVGVFDVTETGDATGTFLTTTGDYRYLWGRAEHDGLTLQTFDGAHAFLFTAQMTGPDAMAGDFWSGNWWHETWTASRDDDAALPDAFTLTERTTDRVSTEQLEGLPFEPAPWTAETDRRHPASLAEAFDPSRPALLYVFGTWCPNCKDATAELAELSKANPGLDIIAIAFEHRPDGAAERVRTYLRDAGVRWPAFTLGLSDKGGASEAFPLLDRIRSYPTVVFVDRGGAVRAVHQGFTGPATGAAYDRMRAQFRGHIRAMTEQP